MPNALPPALHFIPNPGQAPYTGVRSPVTPPTLDVKKPATDEDLAFNWVAAIRNRKHYMLSKRAAEDELRTGLSPPFSCEQGNCATCMAHLEEGSVKMRLNNALTPEEVEEGWILTCQGLPTSAKVVVDYDA